MDSSLSKELLELTLEKSSENDPLVRENIQVRGF